MSSATIYTHTNFIDNKYKTLYFKIINNAKNRSDIFDHTERHHIIPKSMGGDNSPENLVVLTTREHFICHYLLVKFTKDKGRKSMTYAFAMMKPSKKHKNRYFNSRLYASLRSIVVKIISETHKGKKRSLKTIKKHSESLKKSGKVSGSNNGMAKTWEVTSPDESVYIISGNLEKFCNDKNILRVVLVKNIGKPVPEISPKFRDKGNKQYRINTIGWKLSLAS
jgi:hypothetical protein